MKSSRFSTFIVVALGIMALSGALLVTPSSAIAINGGFEASTSGWSASSGTTLQRVTSPVQSGVGAAKLTRTGAAGDAILNDSPNWYTSTTIGTMCTATAWVQGPAGSTVRIRFREYQNGTTNVGSNTTTLLLPDAGWNQISVTRVSSHGGAMDLNIYGANAATGSVYYVDDVTEDCGSTTTTTSTTTTAPTSTTTTAPTSTTTTAPTSTTTTTPTSTTPPSTSTTTTAPTSTTTAPSGNDPTVVAAGDIACAPGSKVGSSCHQAGVAQRIGQLNPTVVIPLGDLQYGGTTTAADFQAAYGPHPGGIPASWGDHKAIPRPTVGSHEYEGLTTAVGYFDYWNGPGATDGPAGPPDKGYYSYDLGSWHIVTLNTQRGSQANGTQDLWLRSDLAAHSNHCTLATSHHPRFSSGVHGNQAQATGLFASFYNGGGDVLVSANDHLYERFAPQNPSAILDPTGGVRQFVVGTGGRSLYSWGTIKPNSEFRDNTKYGVIKLTLHPTSYDWQFITEAGVVLDSGYASCH